METLLIHITLNNKMGSIWFQVLIIFLFHSLCSIASKVTTQSFLKCLSSHPHPLTPITNVVHTPQNASFEQVLSSYARNLRFSTNETNTPMLIVEATNISHIQASVLCSRTQGLQIKIRSGGHDYEGLSYTSTLRFFILDIVQFRDISIDIENQTAWVQSGSTLGELYYRIAEKSPIHAFPAGVCPTVGVGGHFSGGGYGNMMRKYGLSVDHIIDAEMVSPSGRLLNRSSMGEDLFWAIRGGGGASFAVVVSWKIHLVRVPKTVAVFSVSKTLAEGAIELVHRWQNVAPSTDPRLFLRFVLQVSTQNRTRTLRASFIAMFLGTGPELLSVMNRDFPELGIQGSDCIEMSWVRSVLYSYNFPNSTPTEALLDRQTSSVEYLKRKSDYVMKPISLDDLKKLGKKMIELNGPRLVFNPYGGRMSEISSKATPFPHRAGNLYMFQYSSTWSEVSETEKNMRLIRELYRFMTPYVSSSPRSSFLNYRDLDVGINPGPHATYQQAGVWATKYFKGNYDRLVSVKTKVDPRNLLWNEQSIPSLFILQNQT